MSTKMASTIVLLTISGVLLAGAAHGDEVLRNWWMETGHDPAWGKPCQISVQSNKGTTIKTVRCGKGVAVPWAGVWKDEFPDGPCRVRLEATHDVFRSEVKCPPR